MLARPLFLQLPICHYYWKWKHQKSCTSQIHSPYSHCIAASQTFHGDQSWLLTPVFLFLPISLLTWRAPSGQVAAAAPSSLRPWRKCSLPPRKPRILMWQNNKHIFYKWNIWSDGEGSNPTSSPCLPTLHILTIVTHWDHWYTLYHILKASTLTSHYVSSKLKY